MWIGGADQRADRQLLLHRRVKVVLERVEQIPRHYQSPTQIPCWLRQ